MLRESTIHIFHVYTCISCIYILRYIHMFHVFIFQNICIYFLFWIFSPFRSPQSTEYSSVLYIQEVLTGYFIHSINSVYKSIPFFQFNPLSPHPQSAYNCTLNIVKCLNKGQNRKAMLCMTVGKKRERPCQHRSKLNKNLNGNDQICFNFFNLFFMGHLPRLV